MYPMMSTVSSVRTISFFVALGILTSITCPSAFAQSDTEPDIEDRWALQFRVTENFTLGSFQGGQISAKKQYSARRAFRFGLGLYARQAYRTDDRANSDSDTDLDTRVDGTAQWIRYLAYEDALRAYWGLGPTIGFSQRTDDGDQDYLQLRGGAEGALGAEWFVRPRISLSAEYRASLTYVWNRRYDEIIEFTSGELTLRTGSVLFGVSVYF
jgi:hypothetical protein